MAQRIKEVGIDSLLTSVQNGDWRVPQFQREFVWTVQDIKGLINSVFEARPIGMVTLWELESNQGFETERISLEDSNDEGRTFFGNGHNKTNHHAILDGRQRCTSLAMAFGGLKQENKQRRFSGSFFLSLHEEDSLHPVEFYKEAEAERNGLDSFVSALSRGYIPLDSHKHQKTVRELFLDAVARLHDPDIYKEGEMPTVEELSRRQIFINEKFSNFEDATLAVYTVPSKCSLQEICEIFETLNTTGTKVSTVDLVHSFLYADTQVEGEKNSGKNLRGWIDEVGQIKGAHGWADSKDRPELIVQFVASIYLTLQFMEEDLAPPRAVGGRESKIENVKNGSLLALPSSFWVDVMKPVQTERIRSCLLEFQNLIGGGTFPHKKCPYPISAGIFIGLRYFLYEFENKAEWTEGQLKSVFRSFFWRNLLATRYDQGFLTQMTADLKQLIDILSEGALVGETEWVGFVDKKLGTLFEKKRIRTSDEIVDSALDGKIAGALKSGLELRLYARPNEDLLNKEASIEYGLNNDVHVHHIFPKNWVKSNKLGQLKKYIEDQENMGKNPENAAANLMPLTSKSNEDWLDRAPRAVLEEKGITYDDSKAVFEKSFIDEQCFAYLSDEYPPDNDHVVKFWTRRAGLIAADLVDQTRVQTPE
jgi:hypothetical protein